MDWPQVEGGGGGGGVPLRCLLISSSSRRHHGFPLGFQTTSVVVIRDGPKSGFRESQLHDLILFEVDIFAL